MAPPPAASPAPTTGPTASTTGTSSGAPESGGAGTGSPSRPARHRPWLRWVLLAVFALVLGSVFVGMGQWQLDRLHQRQQRNASALANGQAPVRPYTEVFTRPITEADEWQRVEARGVFDTEHQFVVRYRTNGEDKGYEVVTPLLTPDGAVLVDRGFVRVGQGEPIPATAPAAPAGEVRVVGHVRRDERGRTSALTPVRGQMRLINSRAIAQQLPYPVAEGYIGALTLEPSQSADLRPIASPELSDGPHLWYALQWFLFTAIAVAGVVVFIRSDVRDGDGGPGDSGGARAPAPLAASSPVAADPTTTTRPGTERRLRPGAVSGSRHGSGAD